MPKTTTQIPSIAFLYGSAIKRTPHIQAGFIYKARTPDSNNNANKDSYQSATMYPIYNRQLPPENHPLLKYQQLYNNNKPSQIPLPKVKYFTPFLPSNKISGDWRPINFYKPQYVHKGQVLDDSGVKNQHNIHDYLR